MEKTTKVIVPFLDELDEMLVPVKRYERRELAVILDVHRNTLHRHLKQISDKLSLPSSSSCLRFSLNDIRVIFDHYGVLY